MSKRVEIDGKFFRIRRGKLVEIPKKWVGQFPTAQTIRKRPSKHPHKLRKQIKLGCYKTGRQKKEEAHGKDFEGHS